MSYTRILLFTNSNKSAQIEEDASDLGNFVSKMLSIIPTLFNNSEEMLQVNVIQYNRFEQRMSIVSFCLNFIGEAYYFKSMLLFVGNTTNNFGIISLFFICFFGYMLLDQCILLVVPN